jgi:hypothetical protein
VSGVKREEGAGYGGSFKINTETVADLIFLLETTAYPAV